MRRKCLQIFLKCVHIRVCYEPEQLQYTDIFVLSLRFLQNFAISLGALYLPLLSAKMAPSVQDFFGSNFQKERGDQILFYKPLWLSFTLFKRVAIFHSDC